MKPIRVQRKRTKGWRMPPNTVYVGRGSAWGNPFIVGKDGTVQECVTKYAKHLTPYTHKGGSLDDLLLSEANLESIQDQLRGKNLACWCPLDQPCHADVLLRLANEEDTQP